MTAGHVHAAGFPASPTELRALMDPFLAGSGPVIVVHDDATARLVRDWAPDQSAVTVLPWRTIYSSPAKTIAAYRRLFDQCLADGATRIRLTGAVPHPGNGGRHPGWDRYEAAINSIWASYPLDTLCVYDATTPPDVRAAAERTHPWLATAAGACDNPGYDPSFTALPVAPDPLEATAAVVLADPTPAEARRVVTATAAHLPAAITHDLVFGVSEAITNAHLHGEPPTAIRVWTSPTRVVVHVTDRGSGPADPFTGLVPAARERGGLGLWLTHQLDIDVALIPGPVGFTVRLRAGDLG